MAKLKMKYGIDLGTTNSSICKMVNGKPVVIKTDTERDIMPSCVSFTPQHQVRVGDLALNDLKADRLLSLRNKQSASGNVFTEFKRTMGLNTRYESSNMERRYSSEELSAEVLKKLKSFVTDEKVSAAVITVPAKFKAPETSATNQAAQLAGIRCELLQEPIAASMAYGLTADKMDGFWLVFDFGGGTFDAALLQVEDGMMKVKDTEGDNFLGGKNLDYAIVDQIIIPYLEKEYSISNIMRNEQKQEALRDAVKYYAEQVKIELSSKTTANITSQLDELGVDDNGEAIEIDLDVTSEQLKQVLTPIFQKSVNIVKYLLQRNSLKGTDLKTLILVGGPTYSPVLRQMLKEQVTPNVDTSIDPMTAVAHGAALYATTLEYETEFEMKSGEQSAVIDLGYDSLTDQDSEFVVVKLLLNESKGIEDETLTFEVTSSDRSWSSGRLLLSPAGDAVECPLKKGRNNSFFITVWNEMGDRIACYPNEVNFTMSNSRNPVATLPYNIGIEANDRLLDRNVFVALSGLEKNQLLPASGKRYGLQIPCELCPGNADDKMVIPIYQGEYNNEGSSAIYNDHVFDVMVTGQDVPIHIPENSEVDLTLRVDNSQCYHLEVMFTAFGLSVKKEVPVGAKSVISQREWQSQFQQAQEELDKIKNMRKEWRDDDDLRKIKEKLDDLSLREKWESIKDDGREHLRADLCRAFLDLEMFEKKHEWEILDVELREAQDELEKANKEYGKKYKEQVREMRRLVEEAIRRHDVKFAREVKHDCEALYYWVALPGILASTLQDWNMNFNNMRWSDKPLARTYLDKAWEHLCDEEVDAAHHEFVKLYDLLDGNDRLKVNPLLIKG